MTTKAATANGVGAREEKQRATLEEYLQEMTSIRKRMKSTDARIRRADAVIRRNLDEAWDVLREMFKQVVDAVRQLLLLLRDMEQKQTFLLVVGAGLHFISLTPTPATAAESGAVTSQASPSPALPAPGGVPQPGPTNDAPYAPQPILQGGVVIPLYPPGSPFLKRERVREAE